MYVILGNSDAIEGYYDPADPNQDRVLYRPVEGERTTRLLFPEGTTVAEAYATTLATLPYHFDRESQPKWVESDSQPLADLIAEHFKIKATRPATWGQEGAAERAAAKKTTRKRAAKKAAPKKSED